MQITSGLISCDPTVDPSLVTGNASVDWTQVTVGNLLIVQGISYSITDVNYADKLLRISPNWVGAAATGITYVIVRDFTMNMQLPMLNPGDLEAAAIYSRAMQILDNTANLATGDPTVTDYVIVQNNHGFLVGNVLRMNGTLWVLANSSSTADSLCIGVVSKIADVNTFWLRTVGIVGTATDPIQGITVVPGDLLYLREAPTWVTIGWVNIGTVADIDSGPLKIPVMQGSTAISAFILTLAQASTNIFGANKSGLVPNPGATLTGRILYDTGWGSGSGLIDDSIQSRHLDPAKPWITDLASQTDWDDFARQSDVTPIHAFILDLNKRIKQLESTMGGGGTGATTQYLFTQKTNPGKTWSWNVPAGVTTCRVTLFPAERFTPTGLTEWYSDGIQFKLYLEGTTQLSGELKCYTNYLNANGVRIAKVGSGPEKLKPLWDEWHTLTSSVSTLTINTTRPATSPFLYYSNFVTRQEKLLGYHYPGLMQVPSNAPNDPNGFHVVYSKRDGAGNPYLHTFGAVTIIETGVGI